MWCRHFIQEAKESEASQVEIFLNSVPLLKSLSREEKLMLVDALEEQGFPAGTRVITQARALSCHPTAFITSLSAHGQS